MKKRCLFMSLAALVVSAGFVVAETPATGPKLPPLTLGQKAPELSVTDMSGKAVSLESFAGKPVVLQFGSITEPVFRKHAADSEKLASEFEGKVACVVIYQREAHAADTDALDVNVQDGFAIAAPVSQAERIKLAQMAIERLGLKKQTVLVDTFNDATSKRFGGRPNMTFLLDEKGGLAAAYPWADTKKLRGAIPAVLAGKTVPAEFQGPMRATTIPAAAFDARGERLSIAIAIDNLTLTDRQKQAILPPIAELMADLRDFREIRQGAGKTTTGPADELQAWTKRLSTSYGKAKDALKANLSDADYKTTLEALNRTLPPRLLNTMDK